MITLSVLMACHNRKTQTMACLSSLFAQQLPSISLQVWLLDDASTDGTADAVNQQFPQVHLLQGSGDMFWTKGMRYCWEQALSAHADFYLWLNDDVILQNDAIARLVSCYQQQSSSDVGAIVGTMQDNVTSYWSYGGRKSISSLFPLMIGSVIEPAKHVQECDYVNGNFCLIPATAVAKIGIFSHQFTHKMGDFDYSLRLKRAGFRLLIAPGCYGVCALHPVKGSLKDPSIPLSVRVAWMADQSKCPAIDEWLIFIRQYGGPFWPFLYLKAIVGRMFPKLWLLLNQFRR